MDERAHRHEEVDGDKQGSGSLEGETSVEGSQSQLANVKCASALARLLLFFRLVSSKGGIDGVHPLVTLRNAGRLQMIWFRPKVCLSNFSLGSTNY